MDSEASDHQVYTHIYYRSGALFSHRNKNGSERLKKFCSLEKEA